MLPSLLLSSWLLFNLGAGPGGGSPPAVHDRAGEAWAVLLAEQLWVCWQPAPGCFVRVEFDARGLAGAAIGDPLPPVSSASGFDHDHDRDHEGQAPAPKASALERGRLGFSSGSLWIEVDGFYWRVRTGQRRATAMQELAPLRLEHPGPMRCGPLGELPILDHGRLDWRAAPACGAALSIVCVGPPRAPVRRPTPLRLRAGLQASLVRSWTAEGPPGAPPLARRQRAGAQLLMVVELGFDLRESRSHARARASLRRGSPLRTLRVPARGPDSMTDPVTARERAAHLSLHCEQAQP